MEVLDPWPEPRPLDGLEGTLPDLSNERLLVPEEVHSLASILAARLAVNRVPVAMAALGVLSGILANRGTTIRPDTHDASWEESPVLWVVLVGPSGSGKTPILRVVSDPAMEIERALDQENQMALEEYEAELQVWLTKKKGERGPKPEMPVFKRLVVSDTTPEALVKVLGENAGVLSVQDELKGLLASWMREDRAEGRALYLSAYSGHPYVVDRKTQGTFYLQRPMLALVGGIQMGPWYKLIRDSQGLSNLADGLLQRITPVILTPGQPLRNPPPLDSEVLEAYRDLVHRLADDVPAVITFTKKAVGLWHEWVFDTRVEIRKEEHTEEWRSLLSKRPGLTARLAGVIAAAKGEKVVSYESLGQAIVLISDLLEPHTKAAWALDEAEEVKDARRLLEHLKANGITAFTTREVYRQKWAGIRDADRAKRAVGLLEAHGWVRYDAETRRWEVNPRAQEVDCAR